MTLDFTCLECDSAFELDVLEILDESRIQCPSCDARIPRPSVEGLSDALDLLLTHVARIRSKFAVFINIDSDDLPSPYDKERPYGASADEDDTDEDKEVEGEEEEFDEEEERGSDADD